MAAPRIIRIFAWLVATGFMAGIAGLAALWFVIQDYSKDLPSVSQLSNYNPPVVTRLYADDGRLLAEYATEKRIFVPLTSIPDLVQQAFISAEDQNFYQHQGIDLWAIARAMRKNIQNIGSNRSMVGGSTITQQVVKNFLLTSEKSFERKIKEAILAYRISHVYSKEKILELYLNQIYLGRGTYGVAAAAINFFNKPLDELNIEEAAMLAAMPKAPSNYDPAKNYERALARRNYVIGRLIADGAVAQDAGEAALKNPIILRSRDETETASADFFAEEVRRRLKEMYGDDVLYEGGLFVKTTVDPTTQEHAERALRHALTLYDRRHGYRGALGRVSIEGLRDWRAALDEFQEKNNIPVFDAQSLAVVLHVTRGSAEIGLASDAVRGEIPLSEVKWARKKVTDNRRGPAIKSVASVLSEGDVLLVEPTKKGSGKYRLLQIPEINGAMVVMDPHQGKVLAMTGGYSYEGSEFNRATQAKRQPGSAMKPFVYVTALENGFSPTSIIMDAPIELPQGPGLPMWKPKNYGGNFLGPTTLRMGLEKSRNAMTVRLAQYIGLGRVKRMAERFGIYSDKTPTNFSMVLGSMETTLIKMTNAYSMMVNGGKRVEPWLIERIDDRNGATIFRRDTRLCYGCNVDDNGVLNSEPPAITDDREQIVDPRVAYQFVSLLNGAATRGTGAKTNVLKRPVGGKTGTTNESRDTWFMGFTPNYVVGTYIGFDTPRPMGAKETGGSVPIQAFIHFIEHALKDVPKQPFVEPDDIRKIPVNRITGQPLFEGEVVNKRDVIDEAFLVGGPIFKPEYELDAEVSDPTVAENMAQEFPEGFYGGEGVDPYAPVDIGVPLYGAEGLVPPPGEVAPYQRPIENPEDIDGFNINSDAETGTGGYY